MPPSARLDMLLFFWGGDCTGLLILLPLATIGHTWLGEADEAAPNPPSPKR